MTDWAATASILLRLQGVMDRQFRLLRDKLPETLHATGPDLGLFQGFPATGGAGAEVRVIARHDDGRQLSWAVEVRIDRWPPGESWYATVKGEIDLDDDQGDDYCVLNEQRTVDNAKQAADAIEELAMLVASYPLPELLTKRWSADDHSEDEQQG